MGTRHYEALVDAFDSAGIPYQDLTEDLHLLCRQYRVPDRVRIGRAVEMDGEALFFFDGAGRCVGRGGKPEVGAFRPVGD